MGRRGPKAKREGAVRDKMISARVARDAYDALQSLADRRGKTKADVLEDLILSAATPAPRDDQWLKTT